MGALAMTSTAAVLTSISLLIGVAAGMSAAAEKDRVGHLPGQPAGELPLMHFSGYVGGGAAAARHFFYYFVKHDGSARPAEEAPLIVWVSSGRFCSAVGYGGMLEVGPLRVQADLTLRLNEYSWHKEANVLFVDLPAGVGFSYSNKNLTAGEATSGNQIAREAVSFLQGWTKKFPEHRFNEMFLLGEGFGAHHAVRLALHATREPSLLAGLPPLKGLLLGNPEMDLESTFEGFVDYLTINGMMGKAGRDKVLRACVLKSPLDCATAMHQEAIGLAVYISAIKEPLCTAAARPSSKYLWYDPCSENYLEQYLQLPAVQQALHANSSGRVPGPWHICSKALSPGLVPPGSEKPTWIIDALKELVGKGDSLKLAVYHGDENARPPVTSTKYCLAKVFNHTDPAEFGHWKDSNGDVGGYTSVYMGRKNNVTFSTVRGSGGYVGSYQPLRARDLLRRFLGAP
ncbi:unnamed protein product [Linum tenue]|uniref:Uncharacterized protein n=1 Tax=Linum tenue TaxID=586396 RepID=A0AAV0P2V1_9ROSI|nr:unnamed protein product [Linum tenue]